MRRGLGSRHFGAGLSRRSASSRRFNHHYPGMHRSYSGRGYRRRHGMYGGLGYGMGGYYWAGPILGLFFVFIFLFAINPIIGLIGIIAAIYLYNKSQDVRKTRKPKRTSQQVYSPDPIAQTQQPHQQKPSNQTMNQGKSGYYQRPEPSYCKACGAGLFSDSKFCGECGTKV